MSILNLVNGSTYPLPTCNNPVDIGSRGLSLRSGVRQMHGCSVDQFSRQMFFGIFKYQKNLLPCNFEHQHTRATDVCALMWNANDRSTGIDLLLDYY